MKIFFKSSLTKNALYILLGAAALNISSCQPAAEKAAETGIETGIEAGTKAKDELADLVLEAIPGSSLKYARQIDSVGRIEIEGFVKDGKKEGQWIRYYPEGDIMLINHFVNGMLEGTALHMAYRNQVDLKLTYKQNQLDGPWISYKFGKIIEERLYKAGKLEGTLKLYNDRTFKIKQEAQYKNGLQDGYLRYYDDDGNVTLAYEYKNGEKISGGIVEPKK